MTPAYVLICMIVYDAHLLVYGCALSMLVLQRSHTVMYRIYLHLTVCHSLDEVSSLGLAHLDKVHLVISSP